MSSHLDYFSDLLNEGEHIRSTVAGPGAPEGNTETWFQLATTEDRVLSVKLQKNTVGNYQPVQRMAGLKTDIQINRYPKTDQTVARLDIVGLEEPITIVEIDRPDIFPLVEPFIVSWGGRLGGSGTVRPSDQHEIRSAIDEKKLLMIAIGLLGVTIFFCACAGILGSIIAFTQGQP